MGNTENHWLMQDGASSHVSRFSLQWIAQKFPGRVISLKTGFPWAPWIHWIILFGDTWKTQSIEVPPWQLKNLNCQSIKTLQRSMMTRNSVKGCLKISKNESQHAPKEMVAIWSIFCKKKVKSINECEKKLFFFFKTALLSYLCCCSLGDLHEMGTCFCSWLKFNFQKFALLCY